MLRRKLFAATLVALAMVVTMAGQPVKAQDDPDGKIYTIEELYANKERLAGKIVTIQGKVIKVSSGILGMNWVHIKDGTSFGDNRKVVFTSKTDTAEKGDTITASGKLATDKDFGAGYFYSIIVEGSRFVK